ncbi:hypothetical protein EMEDMD4_1350019 [Sinorhizobium medicae]|uniref:Uncharacterized protein n=1 Tax=Sinorhizobium medicae TaxID=110321 RepID=A0A508WRU2_9HYPH|nr:hypothetical protein EMEDMD4_1350019 [Sinorhizobium medicae]
MAPFSGIRSIPRRWRIALSSSSGLSYEDGVAIPVLALLASHSPLEAKDSLTFAEPRSQRPPIQPVDVTAAPALA